jgi:galactonate dehydratase
MLSGPVRNQLRLYWSHCGTYRLHHAEKMGLPPVRNLDDICKLGEHVRQRGFTALKTNIFLFDGAGPELYMPGFVRSPGGPELNPSIRVEEALDKQLAAFRDGTGRTRRPIRTTGASPWSAATHASAACWARPGISAMPRAWPRVASIP